MTAPSTAGPDSRPILPGATLGVLGGGQLGRMFALAAARLGYRVHVYAPEHEAPAADAAARRTAAAYEDSAQLAAFAKSVDVVTLEFENVPRDAADVVQRYAPLRPGSHVLWHTQHRLREKRFLAAHGIPCTPFAEAADASRLAEAVATVGFPCVLKTAAWGYDGKGQHRVRSLAEAAAAQADVGGAPVIVEQFVDFQAELSVLVARSTTGASAACGPIANSHDRHILDVSTLPRAELAPYAAAAREMALAVVEALEAVGLVCVEFFLARDGRLLVNEIAPRPHNSGHLTIDACACSQFEQQVRAICGLPLGSFELLAPAAAMANLLGDLWHAGTPRWTAVLGQPDVRLHLYGKTEPRGGRKMGHLTALGSSAEQAEQRVIAARSLLASFD